MDTLGALALATEPPNDELMKRPPVGRGASFITKTMWRNIIGQSIYQLAVLGVLNFGGKKLLGLTGPDSTEVLNTLIFNTFVFCQVHKTFIPPKPLRLLINTFAMWENWLTAKFYSKQIPINWVMTCFFNGRLEKKSIQKKLKNIKRKKDSSGSE